MECSICEFSFNWAQNIAQSEEDVLAGKCLFSSQTWGWVRRHGKEGRKGSRKEECNIFTNSGKVTQTLSAPHLNQKVSVRSRNCALRLCVTAPITASPTRSGASTITALTVVYLLLPKHVFVLHFLTLKGKGGELNLVWGSILREPLLRHLPARTGSRQNDSPRYPWASRGHTTAPDMSLLVWLI